MVGLIVALVLCVALGAAVVAVVAMPARREGRDLLAPKGEEVLDRVKEAATSAKEHTSGLIAGARHTDDTTDADAIDSASDSDSDSEEAVRREDADSEPASATTATAPSVKD